MQLWIEGPEPQALLTLARALGSHEEKNKELAMEEMMKPNKVHARGCLHSEKPEMIVCKVQNDAEGESRLTSSLYFRRCDGTFSNITGEVLKRKV